MLNEYVWKLYLKSGGEDVVEFFRKNLHEEMTEEYPRFIRKLVDILVTENNCRFYFLKFGGHSLYIIRNGN